MTSGFFRNAVFTVVALAAAVGLGIAVARADDSAGKALTKQDVEKIVHDYIMNNAQVIMDSVDNYQRQAMETNQKEAYARNKETLTGDNASPEVGNAKGDVTVFEFFDFNCHFCKQAWPTVQSLLQKDKNVRVVFKDFPILGPSSEAASKWALAAQKQGKYFEFYKALMDNKTPISDSLLEKLAKDVGLDVDKLKKDVDGDDISVQIQKNRALARSLGLSGTPAFVIGDDIAPGAIPLEDLESRVAAQRAKAK